MSHEMIVLKNLTQRRRVAKKKHLNLSDIALKILGECNSSNEGTTKVKD